MRHQPKPDPSFLQALLAAVPDKALRPLVLELLNGAAETAPPATPVRRRRRGWPKGKPRGRRPSTRAQEEALPPKARAAQAIAAHPEKTNRAIAEEIGVSVQTVMRARHQMKGGGNDNAPQKRRGKPRRPSIAVKGRGPGRPPAAKGAADPKLVARRAREAERLRVKRAAGKQAKAEQHSSKVARAKLATAETSKVAPNGNGAKNGAKVAEAKGTKVQGTTESHAFWSHAEKLAPNNPWHVVAMEFGANEAQVKNCYRSRALPPGLNATAIERFLEVHPT